MAIYYEQPNFWITHALVLFGSSKNPLKTVLNGSGCAKIIQIYNLDPVRQNLSQFGPN